MRTPPLWAGPKILGPDAHCMETMGVRTTTSTTYPHKLYDLPVLRGFAERVLETTKRSVCGGGGVQIELHPP